MQLDAVDSEGNTALHHGAKQNQAEAVKLLLQAGSNPGLQNKAGKKPMDFAKDADVKALLAGTFLMCSY
jgi:ankyrin repeat protein